MPKITVFNESRKLNALTGFRATPDVAKAQGQEKLARGVGAVGDAAAKFGLKQRELESQQAAQRIKLETEQAIETRLQELRAQGLSSREFERRAQQVIQDEMSASQQKLGSAGGFLGLKQAHRNFVENSLGIIATRSNLTVAREARQMFVSEAKSEDERLRQQQENLEARAPEEQIASRRAIRHRSIQAGVGTIRTQEQADLEKLESDRRVAIGRTELEIHQNPAKVLEQLEGDPPKELRSGDIAILRRQAVARMNALRAEQDRREIQAEKQLRKLKRKTADEVDSRILNGDITEDEIESLRRRGLLEGEDYRRSIRMLRNPQFLEGPGNPDTAQEMELDLLSGRPMSSQEINAAIGDGGINKFQAARLQRIRLQMEQSRMAEDPRIKEAVTRIKTAVSVSGPFAKFAPGEAQAKTSAVREFLRRARAGEDLDAVEQDVINKFGKAIGVAGIPVGQLRGLIPPKYTTHFTKEQPTIQEIELAKRKVGLDFRAKKLDRTTALTLIERLNQMVTETERLQ